MAPLRRLGSLAHFARSPFGASTPSLSQIPSGAACDNHGSWPRCQHSGPIGFRHNSTSTTSSEDPSSTATPGFTSSPSDSSLAAASPSCSHDLISLSPLEPATSSPLLAASALEDSAIAAILSPAQLGAQVWEGAHAACGLPWWAAIPATTLALRGLLLPLSLRAHAASANVALLHRAVGLAGQVAREVERAAQQREQQQREQQAGAEAVHGGSQQRDEEAAGKPGSSGSGRGGAAELGRVELVRRVLGHLRAVHGAPAFGWYLGNAALQAPLLLSLTLALRRMSDSLWPGLTSEGALYFPDLTAPPVILQTLSTPYGTAGAILPLALVLLYSSAVDRSAGGVSPGINIALKVCAVPLYCLALQQPHAVLLYWLTHAATQLATYALLDRLPALRRAVGVPEGVMGPAAGAAQPPQQQQQQQQQQEGAGKEDKEVKEEVREEAQAAGSGSGSSLDDVLLALAESYGRAGRREAARSCLQALLARQPGHELAAERLAQL